jgi:hypothetical protein
MPILPEIEAVVSFLQLDLSLALSCSLNKNDSTSQEWVRPLAQVDLMREGEGFSNLTVEIRSDGWLRFGVSSLTLTLIISHLLICISQIK